MSFEEIGANVVVMVAIATVFLALSRVWDAFAEKRDEANVSSWRMVWIIAIGTWAWVATTATSTGGQVWQGFGSIVQRHSGN